MGAPVAQAAEVARAVLLAPAAVARQSSAPAAAVARAVLPAPEAEVAPAVLLPAPEAVVAQAVLLPAPEAVVTQAVLMAPIPQVHRQTHPRSHTGWATTGTWAKTTTTTPSRDSPARTTSSRPTIKARWCTTATRTSTPSIRPARNRWDGWMTVGTRTRTATGSRPRGMWMASRTELNNGDGTRMYYNADAKCWYILRPGRARPVQQQRLQPLPVKSV